MKLYLPGVMLISALIDLLLLVTVCRMHGLPVQHYRLVAASALGGGYAGWCLISGFHFLGNIFWRLVFLILMGVVTFGLQRKALRPCIMFALLNLAVSGVVGAVNESSLWALVGGGVIIAAMCLMFYRGSSIGDYISVELLYGQKHLQLTALRDTGNTLRDPLTGRSVLVIGADAACQLTGLTKDQLRNPVESVGALPGLRLIPYHTIGQPGGLLLALYLPKVKIGKWQGSSLVALAPEGVGSESTYQALTGGAA